MTTFQITMARPDDGEMDLFRKLFRAAARVEDRWNSNTVQFLAEDLQNDDLSRAQKLFLFRAWQVLVDGHGGFGRLMGAFDTYVHNFQNASADYVDLKPSLQELWENGQILPVVLEAYEEAKQDGLVNWEAAASLNVENEELKRKVAALEQQLAAAGQKARNFEEVAHGLNSENDTLKQQLAAERARVVKLPPIYPCICANSDIVDGNHAGQRSYREDVIEALKAAKIPVEGE